MDEPVYDIHISFNPSSHSLHTQKCQKQCHPHANSAQSLSVNPEGVTIQFTHPLDHVHPSHFSNLSLPNLSILIPTFNSYLEKTPASLETDSALVSPVAIETHSTLRLTHTHTNITPSTVT